MATETNDTRALTAALEAATPFRTLVGTAALHAAERHVDRWAPETGAVGRSRSLRSLAFVDRLVSPWMTTAQQSAALRMYGEYASSGMPSRNNASAVSWVFPRPWFQDELDWMAAARQVAARPAGALTTRGTYVSDEAGSPPLPPVMVPEQRMSPAYAGPMEMVAPALSLGRTPSFQVSPEGRAVGAAREIGLSTALPMPAPLATWSPLVPFAAAQAAQVFAAAITAAVETGLAEQSPMLSSFALVSPADLVAIATREVADAQAAGTLPQLAGAPAADGRRAASAVPAAPGRALGGLGAGVLQAQLAATLQQIESIRKFGGESTTLGIARSAPEMSTPPAPFADAPMREHGGPERLLARMDAVRATEAVVAAAAEAVRVAIAERDAAAPSVASPSVARATTPDQPQAREQVVEAPSAIAPAFSAPTPVVDGATTLETRAPDVRAPVSSAAPSTVAPVTSVAAIESAAAVPAAPVAPVAPQAAPAAAIRAAALDTTKPAEAAAPSIPAPAATATAPERRDTSAQPLPESVLSAVVEAVATSLPTGVARALSQPGALSSETMAAIARTVAASPAAAAALRVIELVTRGAAQGTAPDSVGGPRIAMPAGLGGLAVAVDTASAMQRPMVSRAAPMTIAARIAGAAPAPTAAERMAPSARMPFAPIWAASTTQTSALAAIASERPAAVGHVAWADRWLARFAGASPQALSSMDSVAGAVTRAPSAVYLSPPELPALRAASVAARAEARPELVAAAPPTTAPRFADGESVPDDVFAAIFAPAARPATRPVTTVTPATSASGSPAAPRVDQAAREPVTPSTLVDRLATSAPHAPDAGLFAGLASSPMAPALAPLLALPTAPSFDPRALYAPQLAASFLSGVVAPQASIHAQGQAQGSLSAGDPLSAITTGPSARRSLASTSAAMLSALSSFAAFAPLSERAALPGFAPQASFAPQATGGAPLASEGEGDAIASRIAALAPGAEYVAPDALDAAPTRAPFRSFADAIDREHAPERPLVAPVAATAMTAGAPSVAPTDEALATADASPTAPAVAAMIARMPTSQLLALRSTLLAEPNRVPSLTGGSEDTVGAFVGAQPSFATRASAWVGADAASASLIDSPLAEAPRGAWNGAPGMTATMAQAWAVEQERTSADLAFDFLPPELVLAARVYGFGPVEAAQAQRLAVSGASGLAAMATALDLTFLRAVHTRDVQRDQHGQRDRAAIAWDDTRAPLGSEPRTVAPITAYPAASPAIAELAPISGTTAASTQALAASAQIGAPAARAESYLPAPGERSALFGIQRRLPRGAFLWPSATVASIGLNATAPEGFETLSVAALELLAASAVADLGAWVVGLDPQQRSAGPAGRASESLASGDAFATEGGASPEASRTAFAMLTGNLSAARPAEPSAFTGASDTRSEDEPSLAEVARVVPSERRGRFEAVYLSLTQTSTGRSLSPSARVARALAMLGRDDGSSPATPIERAAEAWSVLPLLLTGDGQPMATGEVGERPRAAVPTEGRPGLQVLSGRAGEALGSFVAPSAAEIDTTRGGHREREERAERAEARERERDERERVREERREKRERERATRAPATPEFVRTGGLPRTRAGGGEAEIPAWFESAARSMLNERSTGPSDGISMAELTLINAAPTSHVAASTRGTSASVAPSSPSGAGGQSASGGGGEKPDVDGLAQKVYGEILKLIDIERERNGEPYR